jgi:pyrroline-5-carboxylate reductase
MAVLMLDGDIAFIGGGNMARSLIGGLLAAGVPAARLRVADPGPAARAACQALGLTRVGADNAAAATGAAVLVLAVKPQVMAEAARSLAVTVQAEQPLVISVAAGIASADLMRWLGGPVALVRAMPNTPALLGAGATGACASPRVTSAHRATATALLGSVGSVEWLDDEALMDVVTAVSGSGPAYFFLVLELLEAEGVRLGLPAPVARRLAVETAYGAARMARETGTPPAELRAQVTSPGGTTAAALAAFQTAGLPAAFQAALLAARDRGRELARAAGLE